MIMQHLSNKLVFVLLILLLLVSTSFISFAVISTPLFLQELNQKLNVDLANNIVSEKSLLQKQQINDEALQSVFMGLMLVNPVIEVYLLNADGEILAYSAPKGVVKREVVDLAPVKHFLSADRQLPILGNDPRSMEENKVFSVAPITDENKLQGYLYVVLGGQAYDSVVELLASSYVLKMWIVAIVISLMISVVAGFFIFRHITYRLNWLARVMNRFRRGDFQYAITMPEHASGRSNDEIDLLVSTFYEMSERMVQQLRQLQHNDSSRREMIANVSHDLRTPLASLQGYLETLALKGEQLSTEERNEYFHIAYQHSERLGKLISELFELATLENDGAHLHLESFSMSELAQDVSQKFKLLAEKNGVRLKVMIPEQAGFVSADIGLMQRALENLIENAIKYTPEGGEVAVVLEVSDQVVKVVVCDTGLGISDEAMPHIFERFYRVDKHRNSDGTGLGLAIVKRITQLHGCSIDVQSQLNRGTSFSFSLPSGQAA